MIQQLCRLFQRSGHILGLFLTFLGSSFLLLYLSNVEQIPFLVLEIGVASIVIGTILSYGALQRSATVERFFLLTIYVMYFALAVMLFVRFSTYSGTDNLREYRAAQITLNHGWNTPSSISIAENLECKGYLSCLSVTLVPLILSSVTGVSLLSVFEFGLTAIFSLKPVLVYLNVKELFGRRDLAALSAILYSQLYFVIFSYNMRNSVTTILLLCTLLIFFKSLRERNGSHSVLLFFFVFATVISYYTITYFSIVVFLTFSIVTYSISRLRKSKLDMWTLHLDTPRLHPRDAQFTLQVFIFLTSLSLTWFSFIPTSPFFEQHLRAAARFFVPSVPPYAYDLPTKFLVASPLGPLTDNWFRLGVVLAVVGFLILAFFIKKDLKMCLWLSAGGLCLIGFLITFIPYVSKIFGGFTRVYAMGYIFLGPLAALALLGLNKRSKGVVLIVFLLLNLPINLLLPINYRYVLYHPESSVPANLAVTQVYITDAEFSTSNWIREYLPTSFPISVDQRGFYDLYQTDNQLYLPSDEHSFPSPYLFLHEFAVRYGLWVPYGEEPIKIDQTSLINSSCIIYNTGQEMMLKLVQYNRGR